MTVTPHVYSKLSLSLATKLVDLTADDIRIMLLSAYTTGTSQNDAQFVADVLADATETSGPGYTAGGLSVAAPTFTGSGLVWALDSTTDPLWGAATFDASYALVYDATPGSDATNPVIEYFDFGGNMPATGGNYTLTINASGLLTATAV